jgi:anion-transporting  ArsA/GET3 family ATPase
MVLQGKGGVGKSLIAAILAQYNVSKGKQPLCKSWTVMKSIHDTLTHW